MVIFNNMNKEDIKKLLELPRKELIEKIKSFNSEDRLLILKLLKEKEEKEKDETENLLKDAVEEKNINKIVSDFKILKEKKQNLNDLIDEENINLPKEDKTKETIFNNYSTNKKQDLEYISTIYDELKELSNNQSYDNLQRAEDIYNKIINNPSNNYDESFKQLADGSRKLMKQLRGDYISEVGYNK
jgi:hypothetical protein